MIGNRIPRIFVGLLKWFDSVTAPAVDGEPVMYRLGSVIYHRAADGVARMLYPDSITDPGNAGAIPVLQAGVCNLTTAAAETRTLAVPTYMGQRLTLCLKVDGGDCVVTVASAYNQAGNTVITFNDAGDVVDLVATQIAGVLRWRLLANDGATLS